MYISLRFPDGKEYAQTDLPAGFEERLGLKERVGSLSCSAMRKNCLLSALSHRTSDRRVLQYRQQLAWEIHTVEGSRRVLERFGDLGEAALKAEQQCFRQKSTVWSALGFFRFFSEKFDEFFPTLEEFSGQSDAMRRFLMFCRDFGESVALRELKDRAAALEERLNARQGFVVRLKGEEGWNTLYLRRETDPDAGCSALTDRAMALLGQAPKAEFSFRPLTDDEVQFDTDVLSEDGKIAAAAEEFAGRFASFGLSDFLRLAEEALAVLAAEELYRKEEAEGFPVLCPDLADTPSQMQVEGLYFPAGDTVHKKDYRASPLPQLTVLGGDDAPAMWKALGSAMVFAGAGGLVSARQAALFPAERLCFGPEELTGKERDEVFCLWQTAADRLPAEELREAEELLKTAAEKKLRGILLLHCAGNLPLLKRKAAEGLLVCTPVSAGADGSLQALLKEWKLTAEDLGGKEDA